MTRILFIENRYRTLFWETIGGRLAEEGHQVGYMVQNKAFRPAQGKVFVIDYYKKRQGRECPDTLRKLVSSDRAINHFGRRDASHYTYYYAEIGRILDEFNPGIVFGESTAFHELLAIEACKERGIPYLQPSTTRYPTGRFSFYKYDTLEPFGGCGTEMAEEEADRVIESITARKIIPDYMHKRKAGLAVRYARLCELLKLSRAYYAGERFNAPSPQRKVRLERKRKKMIKRWDKMAEANAERAAAAAFVILYPLQMQPEANLDVWGRRYNNQLRNIRSLVEATPEDVGIMVKPNPKSKYELSGELIDYVAATPRVIPLKHNVQMAEAFCRADMVVTATGTIAIECILSNKPVATLINTINNTSPNCRYISAIEEVADVVGEVKARDFPKINQQGKRDFINALYRTGYPGRPYETYINDKNINMCLEAFRDALSRI